MGGAVAVDCRNNCYVLWILNLLLTVLEHVFLVSLALEKRDS